MLFRKYRQATKGTSALDEASCSAQATAQAGEVANRHKRKPYTFIVRNEGLW